MTSYKDLRWFLCTLKVLGLLCTTYEPERHLLRITWLDKFYAKLVFVATQLVMSSMLIYCITKPKDFYLEVYNETGNIYQNCEFCYCCVLQLTINAYCYFRHSKHVSATNRLMHLNQDQDLPRACVRRLKALFLLYILLIVVSMQNYARAYYFSHIKLLNILCFTGLYTWNFTVCGALILFYICIERIMEHKFACDNRELARLAGADARRWREHEKLQYRYRITEVLKCHYHLLGLCHNPISSSYGLIVLGITAYMVLSTPSGIYFIVTVIMEGSTENYMSVQGATITSVLWNLPWIIIFSWLLAKNKVDKEVLETSEVLARFPIGSELGVEKMIQKFLLKNLRPKPKVTAFHFFPLTRDALFKLFTTVMAFVAILIQFKKLE